MIEFGILKTFDSETHKAGVQLAGSLTTYLDDISVSVSIPSSAMVVGNYVLVAIPGGNPRDACVVASWPAGSSGIRDHGGLGGLADDDHSQYLNVARHDLTARHTLGSVVPHESALNNLGNVNAPLPSDDQALAWDAATSKWIAKTISGGGGGASGEGHITILPFSYDSIGQGTWVLGSNSGYWAYYYLVNSTRADGDNLSYKVYLDAGTYTLIWEGSPSYNRGIVDFDIDGIEVASFDLYSPTTLRNVIKKQTGIVIATAGLKTLKCRMDGKNPSSTYYYNYFSALVLWRTA